MSIDFFNTINFLKKAGITFKINENNNRIEVFSPAFIDVYNNDRRYDTLTFINCIHHLIFRFSLKLHINFEHLEGMSAAAAVMLFAEISSTQLITDEPDIITFSQPKNKNAKKIFSEFDFYKAIKPGSLKKINRLKKENCFFQSGTEPVEHAKSAIEALKKSGLTVIKTEARIFQASILEAMSNVRHHSYLPETPEHNKRWWQFAYFDKKHSSLHFVVYDRGIGIPTTMSSISPSFYNEGEKIEHALILDVSSKVDEPGRGKGSREILRTYNKNDNSSLLIYSGKGIYYKDKEDDIEIVDEGQYTIKGTIIEWQIPYKAG
ncbi:hypothetical protein [Pseudoalteromonas sp. Z9A6]|uniref:hypothetical protein n=1 Tax=Pseudoalteromonas sp. Z9A6 TaxID=2686352 RepID=UPI0013FD8D01|nr:hypothetical protein [Pseudoalteromonas sp. Z9A6]